MRGHEMIGDPGVIGLDRAAEGDDERYEGAGEIAEADEADRRAIEREASLRAVEQPFLRAGAEGAIGRGDAAAEIDRHAERHFGDGPREGRARREHVDSAPEAGLVIDVLQEIRLYIDDGA